MKIKELWESDFSHQDALEKTGFWGRQGAGSLIFAQNTGRFCVNHRSRWVQEPETWGTWGGAIDEGEDPAAAARRELVEEAGYTGEILQMIPLLRFQARKNGQLVFTYHNFLAVVPEEFKPRLDWESQDFAWVKWGDWPQPLHPGLAALLGDSASVARIQKLISHN